MYTYVTHFNLILACFIANVIAIPCISSVFLSLDAKLPKIQSVTVTPGYVGMSPNANPSLEVTWSAVDDPAVSYVVRYSQSMGTVTAPPDGASEMSANGNSVTLSNNIAPDKRRRYTYNIWVAATSGGVPMEEYMTEQVERH